MAEGMKSRKKTSRRKTNEGTRAVTDPDPDPVEDDDELLAACTESMLNVTCPAWSTINGSHRSMHGTCLVSDTSSLETSLGLQPRSERRKGLLLNDQFYEDCQSSFDQRDRPPRRERLLSEELANCSSLDPEEAVVLETEKKLLNIWDYVETDSWFPMPSSHTSEAPDHILSGHSTPKRMDSRSKHESSSNGSTLPGRNSSQQDEINGVLEMADYDLPTNRRSTSLNNSRNRQSSSLNNSFGIRQSVSRRSNRSNSSSNTFSHRQQLPPTPRNISLDYNNIHPGILPPKRALSSPACSQVQHPGRRSVCVGASPYTAAPAPGNHHLQLSISERCQGDGKEDTPVRLSNFFQKPSPKKNPSLGKIKPQRYSDSHLVTPQRRLAQQSLKPLTKHQIVTVAEVYCPNLPDSESDSRDSKPKRQNSSGAEKLEAESKGEPEGNSCKNSPVDIVKEVTILPEPTVPQPTEKDTCNEGVNVVTIPAKDVQENVQEIHQDQNNNCSKENFCGARAKVSKAEKGARYVKKSDKSDLVLEPREVVYHKKKKLLGKIKNNHSASFSDISYDASTVGTSIKGIRVDKKTSSDNKSCDDVSSIDRNPERTTKASYADNPVLYSAHAKSDDANSYSSSNTKQVTLPRTLNRERTGGDSQMSYGNSKTQIVRKKHLPAKDFLRAKASQLPCTLESKSQAESLPPRGWRKDGNRKKVPIYQARAREVPEIRPCPSAQIGFRPPCVAPSVTPSISPSITSSLPPWPKETVQGLPYGTTSHRAAPSQDSSVRAIMGSDIDGDDGSHFYVRDIPTPPKSYDYDATVMNEISPMTLNSDATSFMRDGWYRHRRHRPITATSSHKRQKKVWKKFKTFKKQLNKLAASNGNSGDSGTTIKTLGFV